MIQLGDELHYHYKGLSCRLMHLIDECHNQQNIFRVYRLSDDKIFVLLNWAVNELRLSWTESFETPLMDLLVSQLQQLGYYVVLCCFKYLIPVH